MPGHILQFQLPINSKLPYVLSYMFTYQKCVATCVYRNYFNQNLYYSNRTHTMFILDSTSHDQVSDCSYVFLLGFLCLHMSVIATSYHAYDRIIIVMWLKHSNTTHNTLTYIIRIDNHL